ncbi:hypothetical protein [Bradyrhizobium liaoningense]|uniref:hypothetical protein n=1 Tax=Bradyrhizobium liaoningense TaxID=43992 RepID=UPI001BAD7A80|nr:hypothetical protein [Bradyrhizobium liaoningense]MBR0988379.1 hypothetical protein [Bradyrhizobium liaoningense]
MDIEKFVIGQPPSRETREWERVLGELRAQLERICAAPLIASDAEARRIIMAMPHCGDMTEVDALMDQLLIRVGELLSTATGDPSQLTRLVHKAREHGRAALRRNSRPHGLGEQDHAGFVPRARIHL